MVDWPEVEESMKDLECHMKGLNRVFNAGRTHGEEGMERTWKAKELKSSCIPNQRLLAKDHKPVDGEGRPKTRPVCAAARSPNGELSEFIADIVEAAIDARGTEECISTEDLLSVIVSVSEKILGENLNDDELFIGSLDA